MAKYDVFISYSRKDSAIANEICSAFDHAGIKYFIDRQCIGGGMEFPIAIADAICDSRLFLFLASENSYQSKFTNNEITFAFNEKSKQSILPYIIDGSELPRHIRFVFAGINWRNIKEHPIGTILVRDVNQLLKKSNYDYYVNKDVAAASLIENRNTSLAQDESVNLKEEDLPENIRELLYCMYTVWLNNIGAQNRMDEIKSIINNQTKVKAVGSLTNSTIYPYLIANFTTECSAINLRNLLEQHGAIATIKFRGNILKETYQDPKHSGNYGIVVSHCGRNLNQVAQIVAEILGGDENFYKEDVETDFLSIPPCLELNVAKAKRDDFIKIGAEATIY